MPEKKKSNQLHQLLAVEQDRRTKANKILEETISTFTKKQEHFDGLKKTYTAKQEGGIEPPTEIKAIVATVADKLNYSKKAIIIGIDAQISKEETNNSGATRAELAIDNTSFGDLSATSLLALEQQIIKIRTMYLAIPTLDPSREWNLDIHAGKNRFATLPEIKQRTGKREHPIIMYEATKEHPAQVQMGSEDIVLGEFETTYSSGRLTTADKSTLLSRIDSIIDAIKRARARANRAEVIDAKIGDKLFKFINNGII